MSSTGIKYFHDTNTKVPISPSQALILAAWFGMLTGIGEVILLGIKKYMMHRFILLGTQVIWMNPLADIGIFLLLTLPLAVINWMKPGTVSLRALIILLSFLTFLSIALMYTPLHRVAAVVLSLGLAVQSSRIIGKFERLFMRLVNLSFGWMVVGLGLVAFGMVFLKP
jgi:hypothetical protein